MCNLYRMTSNTEAIARLFKALCLCHPDLPTPPGFETA